MTVYHGILVTEKLPLLQIQHILPNAVEAHVDVVAVIRGTVQGIVGYGVHNPGHGRILFPRKSSLIIPVVHQRGRIFHQIIDLYQADVGQVDAGNTDDGHKEKADTGAQRSVQNLPQRLLHSAADIQNLTGHRNHGKDKAQHQADGSHSPEDHRYDVLPEKHIDQIILLSVVGHLGKPGKHIEDTLHEIHQPQKCSQQFVQQDKNPVE
ncbi:hypothetical protein IMSAG185_00066 [Lachnospiraceae bacterium]|nr:hypothetical protein IMSAG185_00066 [Lachnospiraceae bacterium]